MSSGRHWPFLLAGLLASGVLANVYFMCRAVSDPSFAVEPDYYQKAVAWDAHQAEVRDSAALGWSVALAVAPADPATGQARLIAQFSDRSGRPVAGLSVGLQAFHNARAAEVVTARLAETASHAYAADVPVVRPGLWEFRISAARGEERFTAVVDQDAPGVAR
jgi:nitrogen fixation protein FixH